jgi:hypothetical protein
MMRPISFIFVRKKWDGRRFKEAVLPVSSSGSRGRVTPAGAERKDGVVVKI